MQTVLYDLFAHNTALAFPLHLPPSRTEWCLLLLFDLLHVLKGHGCRWLERCIDRVPEKHVRMYPGNIVVVLGMDERDIIFPSAAVHFGIVEMPNYVSEFL